MAEPKKRLSRTRSGNRRSHLSLTLVSALTCSHCGAVNAPHIVCAKCGYYKGKLVIPKTATKK